MNLSPLTNSLTATKVPGRKLKSHESDDVYRRALEICSVGENLHFTGRLLGHLLESLAYL